MPGTANGASGMLASACENGHSPRCEIWATAKPRNVQMVAVTMAYRKVLNSACRTVNWSNSTSRKLWKVKFADDIGSAQALLNDVCRIMNSGMNTEKPPITIA